ncbi:hypothetical protein SAMN04515671_2532 [Nakamurella panacisegetis]|uniref:Uncharacterized protein n=1 Tax=Nakamurella panacisegetis TaxID=1090615 RepID=A0A1H0NXA7_9ACTN|nr:hypothetical protein SAMN04515671_2532 [Nakamurella panacisegetis]
MLNEEPVRPKGADRLFCCGQPRLDGVGPVGTRHRVRTGQPHTRGLVVTPAGLSSHPRACRHTSWPSAHPLAVRTTVGRPHTRWPSAPPLAVRTPAGRPHNRWPPAHPLAARTPAGRSGAGVPATDRCRSHSRRPGRCARWSAGWSPTPNGPAPPRGWESRAVRLMRWISGSRDPCRSRPAAPRFRPRHRRCHCRSRCRRTTPSSTPPHALPRSAAPRCRGSGRCPYRPG